MPEALTVAAAALGGLVTGRLLVAAAQHLPRAMYREWLDDTLSCLHQAPDAGNRSLWQLAAPGHNTPADLETAAANAARTLEALPNPTLAIAGASCSSCGSRLPVHAAAPVLGWVAMRGQCPKCHAALGLRQPVAEVTVGCLFALCVARFGFSVESAAWALFCSVLVCLALIDLDTQLLPDSLNYPLLWLGLLGALTGVTGVATCSALWGAALGYGGFFALGQGARLFAGQDGMGLGDAKLLAALGAWLGVSALVPVVLLSSVMGAAAGAWMLSTSRLADRQQPFAFGPFLVAAALILFIVGPQQADLALQVGMRHLLG